MTYYVALVCNLYDTIIFNYYIMLIELIIEMYIIL